MAQRDDLLRAVQAARSGTDLAAAVVALDAHDRSRTASLQQSRELDMSAADVRRTLQPLPAFERHTAATDWLGEYEAPSDYRTAMIAEASRWYRSVPREVIADREEFEEQALGQAYTAAGKYGDLALDARREFMTYVGYLTRAGASGLPQIQQMEDPKDDPAPTPMPEQVFDNFAPEQNEFNGAIEQPDHNSQISSEQAPGIQTMQQQNGGGSGFGSGPERADVHSTSMDTADSYAEIPLGPPGQIPAQVAGPAPAQPASAPTPMMGQEQDAGAQQRRASYSRPDHEGFRWRLAAAAGGEMTEPVPYHEKCGALHWPDQACGNGQAHTASMAIGYVINAEDFARRVHFENQGRAEGMAVLRAVGADMRKVAQHHNTLVGSFRAEARTEDEIAWLRGYMARVRPVLAQGGLSCEGCGKPLKPGKTGSCKGCRTAAAKRSGSGLDFQIAAEAALARQGSDKTAADSVPLRICPECGSTYCKHWQGRDKPYDLPGQPYGTGEKAGSLAKGAPFAGYKDFAACVAANSDKNDPEAYCGKIKHQVEGAIDPQDRAWSNEPGGYSGSMKDTCPDCTATPGEEHAPSCSHTGIQRSSASSLPQIQETIDSHDNPDPGGDQLNTAVMFPLNPGWVGGQSPDGEQPAGKQAARSSMTPSSAAVKMFGRMDAMEGKQPAHKDGYPFSLKAHGQYLRGWNETAGTIHARRGRPPVTQEQYANMTGRADLHKHYLGVYHSTPNDVATSGIVSGTVPDREPRPTHGIVGESSLRRQADTLTRPHQTTDDDHVPYNSPSTTPDPFSSNEGGGDFAAGMKEGREDAANGEKPTFSDNSSQVSPYVQGYAQGYFSGPPSPGPLDTPHSIGGDSGQAVNAGEAAKEWGTTQASLRRQGACLGCPHPSHLGQPCNAEGCRHLHNPGEEGAGPGMHARTIGHVPDPGAPGYSMPRGGQPSRGFGGDDYEGSGNAYDDNGYASDYGRYDDDGRDNDPGGRHSSSRRRVSAAFVTETAAGDADFRKAYRFGARWTEGMLLVRQGSAAFEAGLYSAIADRPAIQEAWVRTHQRLAGHYPELKRRIEAHASFSRQFVLASKGYLVSARTGCYPVTAATSVDLITDGPGTSPDPMGSTPLNGPGQAPPKGGEENPAAPGGPPPYQTVEPRGHGPVAPDDVLGTPQTPPSESGPFTQTYSGRHPGNTDLAPVAPNLAGGAGYSNTDAAQGDPQHKHQQAMAFRRTVQASLAARRAR